MLNAGGNLEGVDPETGKVIWRFRHRPSYSSPTVHLGRVYLGDATGALHCLDLHGARDAHWSRRIAGNLINTIPLVDDRRVVVASNDARAYGVDSASGELVWETLIDGPSSWEVGSHGGGAVVQTRASVYLLDLDDGKVQRRWSWPGWDIAGVCPADDRLIVRLRSPADLTQCRLLALKSDVEEWNEPCQLVNGFRWDAQTDLIYEARYDGLSILNPSTGERLYSINGGAELWMPDLPAVADGRLYVLDGNGYLFALSHP